MSALSVELLRDPELLRIAEQAHAEVRASAEAKGIRVTRDAIADRIAELGDWRRRALRAEQRLRQRGTT